METEEKAKTARQPLLSGWRYYAFLGTVVTAAVGYLLFSLWGGWREVVSAVLEVGFISFGACLLLSLVNYGFRCLRWRRFLFSMDVVLPWRLSMRIYLAGYALSMTPGKSGEALRCLLLKDYDVSYDKSLAALFAERFTDLLAAGSLALFSIGTHSRAQPFVWAVLALVVLIILFVLWAPYLKAPHRLLFSPPKILKRFAKGFFDNLAHFRTCLRFKNLLIGVGIGMLGWSLEALGLYILLHTLGASISFTGVLFIYIFSIIIGAMTLLPGGLGGTEVSSVQLLIIRGVASPIAVAATLLIRIATLWFSVLLGLFFLPKIAPGKKR